MKRRSVWQALLHFAAFMALSCGPEPETALSEAPGTVTRTDPLGLRPIRQALILGSSVRGAESSREALATSAVGMEVRVVTPDQWRSMTADQFRGYGVLIIGDAACMEGLGALEAAIDTRRTWGPIVDGNIFVIASDPSTNHTPFLVERGVQFALAQNYATGLYLSLGCAYRSAAAGTLVTLLEPFGDFLVAGVGCHPAGHSFVMSSKELTSDLYGADERLGGDGCAARSVFTRYPEQAFAPVVLAVDSEGSMPGAQSYPDPFWDNSRGGIFMGSPYVLARGARPRTPNSPPVAQCQTLILDADRTCGASGSINNGSSDPDGDLVGCTQSPAGPYPLGTTTVTLTCTDSAQQSSSCTATVSVRDVTAPVVRIVGPLSMSVECADNAYTDPGATATDACAGSLPARPNSVVDSRTPGSYRVFYSATDPSGNTGVSADARVVTVSDTLPPVMTLNPPLNQTLECGTPYRDPGFTVIDQCFGELTSTVGTGTVNPNVPGVYVIRYSAVDPVGNQSPTQSRTVSVIDTLPPDITVLGPLEDSYECGSTYVDPGATATDRCFGAVPVTATQAGSPGQPGSFTIAYSARDPAGNSFTSPMMRHVTVTDHESPVLTLLGAASQVLECGPTPYVDPGATATDQCFGDLTSQIVRTGSVNTRAPGTYPLTYNVADLAGNSAVPVNRTVQVRDTVPPMITFSRPNRSDECNPNGTFVDDALAIDACAGPVPIERSGTVDLGRPGVYILAYTVRDPSGNSTSSATRAVSVIDTLRPTLVINGPLTMTIVQGEPFVDPGATARDQCEGPVPVTRTGEVNTDVPGTYLLRYSATDISGNRAERERTIVVVEAASGIASRTSTPVE